jgi:hypothetical protein
MVQFHPAPPSNAPSGSLRLTTSWNIDLVSEDVRLHLGVRKNGGLARVFMAAEADSRADPEYTHLQRLPVFVLFCKSSKRQPGFRSAAPSLCSRKGYSKEGVFVLQSGVTHIRR